MLCGTSVAEPFAIHLDPSKDFIRDLRDTSAAPVLGYAGSMLEFNDSLAHVLWHDCSDDLATALRDGGARLVKEWNSLDKWQIGMAYAQAKSEEERASLRKRFGRSEGLVDDPKVWFSFRKKHGMKVFICLEQYRVWTDVSQGVKTNEIGIVKKTICDYLRWIRDNGFADQVAGFELGNEPYWGKDPEEYGRRWCEIVPEMKKIWLGAKIGIPLAEYRPNDPDIAAVRAGQGRHPGGAGRGDEREHGFGLHGRRADCPEGGGGRHAGSFSKHAAAGFRAGGRVHDEPRRHADRIIPTRVGRRSAVHSCLAISTDHPHACGEKPARMS